MALRRWMEHSIETLPDEGDEVLAQTILDAWSDDLSDLMAAVPHPEGWHPAPTFEGDDSVRPHGYAGYAFLFVKGSRYAAIVIPKHDLPETVDNIAVRTAWERSVRNCWEQSKGAEETA